MQPSLLGEKGNNKTTLKGRFRLPVDFIRLRHHNEVVFVEVANLV